VAGDADNNDNDDDYEDTDALSRSMLLDAARIKKSARESKYTHRCE